ncbi:hypothetical protein EP7_004926 [Isosphaeraceae bacterium EP7]
MCLIRIRLASVAATAALLALCPASARSGTYPQLVATQYDAGAKVPPPTVVLPDLDASKLPPGAKVISSARAASGRVWVLTDQGPFRSTAGGGFEPLDIGPHVLEPGQPEVRWGAKISSLVSDPTGHIWAGTDRGIYLSDGEQWWQSLNRLDGVPFETINCLHLTPNGDLWAGTPEGAWRLRDGQFRYFWGRRWLPDNDVRAIWTDTDGRAWFRTKTGLASIEEASMTLAQKAAHYDRILQSRHNRRGYICEIDLKTPGDPTKGAIYDASDNDGLWTSMYVGAMALRYAATKDPAARQQAKASMDALLNLERLSGIPGFPARSMVTDAEIAAGIRGFDPEGTVHAPGDKTKVWYRSKAREGLWCKGDTSSDELDGHYFAWFLYHDLVADDAEKREIAAVVRRVTDGIIEHGFTLVDHTGRKTRWGIWAPELINNHPLYYDLRALNSLEILSFLKVAEHITGDSKYAEAANKLIREHHYLINSLLMRRGATGRFPDINHSDDELLYLVYYPLLMLEKDPARRRVLVQSIARTWEPIEGEQAIRPEHNPFYNFIYGATTGRRCDVDEAKITLQDWPLDLVSWTTKNSQRHDVRMTNAPGIRRHSSQLDRVLSPAERSQARWNSNPWVADGGHAGRTEDDGVAWTVAYWLGVHHGYLSPDE